MKQQYKLVFEENFTGSGAPNEGIWNRQVGEKWANNESQCYVDDLEHVFIENSILHLRATYEKGERCPYKSGRVNTLFKKHFKYGRFVVRAKMPKGRGSWPAIWFLGRPEGEKLPWPKCGEIDLLEYAGNYPNRVTCAIHTESYNHKIHTEKTQITPLQDASDLFHDYMLEWTSTELKFFVDENEVMSIKRQLNDGFAEWPFDQEYYLILNLAVGGWYAGKIVDEDLPYEFQVDYIKVYQKED